MGKPATKLYTVYYKDGTYLSYNFTKEEYDRICKTLIAQAPSAVITRIGVLVLIDVRSVILQRKNADVPQNEGVMPDMPQEAKEWLKAAQLGERILNEEHDLDNGGEEDYEGGMIA